MKRFIVIFLLCGSSFLLTACWDRFELEERANILGLAIDIAEDVKKEDIPQVTHVDEFPGDNKTVYRVTAQMAVPGKIQLGPEGASGGGSEKTSWILETYGYTMEDSLANLQQQLAERLYLGHLQLVVISEDVAKSKISEVNDFLRREYEVRRTGWMVVSEGPAYKVLKTAPPLETVPALYLSDTLKNAYRFGKLPKEYLGKIWIDLSDMGIDATLPYIRSVSGDRILVEGMVYLKDTEMVGKLLPIQIGFYLAMLGENPAGYSVAVELQEAEGIYIVESIKRKSNLEITLENGKPKAKVHVEIKAAIEEETKAENLSEEKINKVEEAAARFVQENSLKLIKQLQKDQSDIVGIGARIRALYPKYWSEEIQTSDKWAEVYSQMDIDITVDYTIERTGMRWK